MVTAEIKRLAKKHGDLLHRHTNMEAIQLLDNERTVRRLKRLKAISTSVVQVHVSVNSDMDLTTMCSRYQMLGHTGGHSLRRLLSVVV
jgi:hypothetical protein